MPRLKKDREELVTSLSEKLAGGTGLVVAGYVGVKTPELNELRGKLRPVKGCCQIVKNRLAKIAFKNNNIDSHFGDLFEGQSALILQEGDAVAGLKVLVDFEKTHAKLKIRGAFLEGKVFDANQIKILATLPSKNQLMSIMLSRMMGPVTGLAGVLTSDLRTLAGLLEQICTKKKANG